MRVGERPAGARDLVEDPAEADLRRHRRPSPRRPSRSGTGTRGACLRRWPFARTARSAGTAADRVPATARPSNASHSRPSPTFIMSWKASICVPGHQPGMVVLVAGKRQAETLDRVGDEAGRPVVAARRLEGVEQARQIVAAEIGHQRARARHPSGASSSAVHALARRRPRPSGACARPRRPGRSAPNRAGSDRRRSRPAAPRRPARRRPPAAARRISG